VAPRTGTVSTAEELQMLMMSLVPGVEPTSVDEFHEGDDEMRFGKLYFDEYIGTKETCEKIVLTDKDMFSTKGFVDGKIERKGTEKIERRAWVRLYPNIQTAMSAENGTDVYRIKKKKLGKTENTEQGFLSRLLS
jgi:hypothetical protein